MLSLYLLTGEEDARPNIELLAQIGEHLEDIRPPRVILGDVQMSPATFAATGFATHARGALAGPLGGHRVYPACGRRSGCHRFGGLRGGVPGLVHR